MASIRVNGVEQSDQAAWPTWSAVLDALDAQLAPSSQIVTAVRFDGLDEPAFRDPEVTARSLADVALVEVESGTPADLVSRSVQEVTAALVSLRDDAVRTGEAFRRFDVAVANSSLAELATKLTTLMAIVQAIGLALRLNLDEVPQPKDSAAAMVSDLAGFVEVMIVAQQAEDWIGVADVVEYDLLPALQRWQGTIEAFGRQADPAVFEAVG